MRITATVTVAGDTYTVSTRPVDVVKWEKGTKRKITDGLGFSDLAQLVHSAARRDGLTDLPFDAWVEALDEFEPQADEDPNRPQQDQS